MSSSVTITGQIMSRVMNRIAPLQLAESWDNVGLLLESSRVKHNARRVLLTVDLTQEVVEEALEPSTSGLATSAIICYHPPLFRPLKSFTLSNPLQRSMLTCLDHGISIYSPHTALDSVAGGVNDWLAGLIHTTPDNAQVEILGREKEGFPGAGVGRLVKLPDGVPLLDVVQRVKSGLVLKHVQLARSSIRREEPIRTVAICAGSGSSVLEGTEADLYFTGEMSHHEVLAAVARGTHVLLCGHSNTERGYLQILKNKLESEFAREFPGKGLPAVEVQISEADADPLVIV